MQCYLIFLKPWYFWYKFLSSLIPENDCSQVHVVTGEVPRILGETLVLLKPLNGMRFNELDILSGRVFTF